MPPQAVSTPTDPPYRIARAPDPLAWVPWPYVGDGRFDGPRRRFRVLYAGERRACFLEILALFGLTLDGLTTATLTSEWLAARRIARFSLDDPAGRGRWLDVWAAATLQALRRTFASYLRHTSSRSGRRRWAGTETDGPWLLRVIRAIVPRRTMRRAPGSFVRDPSREVAPWPPRTTSPATAA